MAFLNNTHYFCLGFRMETASGTGSGTGSGAGAASYAGNGIGAGAGAGSFTAEKVSWLCGTGT